MNTKQNNTENNPSAENEEQKEQIDVQADNVDKTAELTAKIAELNDKYLRLYSEFDNFRKRTSKEKVELIQNAGEDGHQRRASAKGARQL